MSTITQQESDLSSLAREMDSPTAVVWTSIHVMRRCLERISDGDGNPGPTMDQLQQNMDLVIAASERLVKINRNLQRAIHRQDECCGGNLITA